MTTGMRLVPSIAIILALAGGADSLWGQGLGGSAAIGLHQRMESGFNAEGPGIGVELAARWAARSGLGVGLGGRLARFPQGDSRGSAFIELRHAPVPTRERRVRPVVGARAGLFVGESDGDGSPLFGIEAGPVAGIAIYAARGVSVTVTGELSIVLAGNYLPVSTRRLLPGLQVGFTLH